MYSRLDHNMHIREMWASEQYGFVRGISTEDAAFKLTDSVWKSVKQKCMLEEYSVTWQWFLSMSFIKFS